MILRSTRLATVALGTALFQNSPSLPPSAALAAGFPIDEARGGIPTLSPILNKTAAGVVNIATSATVRQQQNPLLQDPTFRQFFEGMLGQRIDPNPGSRTVEAAGSGVIVDARRGYILTNHHVVDGAEKINVTLADQRQFEATLIGTDTETDIAVLQIEAADLTAVPLDEKGDLKVGDFVIAVGNPFGLGQTVTSGIISALGRGGLHIEGYEDFIQTDASINPGNSGGALIDLNGRLIGVNTAIIGPSGGNVGIGFAVPVTMARAVMEQLIEFGEVRRGRVGIEVADLSPPLAKELGIQRNAGSVVMAVEPGSTAEKAGLKRGDVITRVNGQDTRDTRMVRNRLGLIRAGEQVELTYVRGDRTQTVKAELMPAEDPQPQVRPAASPRPR